MEASIDRATRSMGRARTRSGASSASRSRTSPGSRATGWAGACASTEAGAGTLARGRHGDGDAEAVDRPPRVEGDGGGLERGQPVARAPAGVADQDAAAGVQRAGRRLQADLHAGIGRAAALLEADEDLGLATRRR